MGACSEQRADLTESRHLHHPEGDKILEWMWLSDGGQWILDEVLVLENWLCSLE